MLCPHFLCIGVLFCILSYRFVVSIENLDLDRPLSGMDRHVRRAYLMVSHS